MPFIYYLLFIIPHSPVTILPITNTTTRERANASDNPYMLLQKKHQQIKKINKNQLINNYI